MWNLWKVTVKNIKCTFGTHKFLEHAAVGLLPVQYQYNPFLKSLEFLLFSPVVIEQF